MKPNRRALFATDHRALVLESVATAPRATRTTVAKDCVGVDFGARAVQSMLWQLRHEGLIGMDDEGVLFVTKAGFGWLTNGRFDRALPCPHERPTSKRRKTK